MKMMKLQNIFFSSFSLIFIESFLLPRTSATEDTLTSFCQHTSDGYLDHLRSVTFTPRHDPEVDITLPDIVFYQPDRRGVAVHSEQLTATGVSLKEARSMELIDTLRTYRKLDDDNSFAFYALWAEEEWLVVSPTYYYLIRVSEADYGWKRWIFHKPLRRHQDGKMDAPVGVIQGQLVQGSASEGARNVFGWVVEMISPRQAILYDLLFNAWGVYAFNQWEAKKKGRILTLGPDGYMRLTPQGSYGENLVAPKGGHVFSGNSRPPFGIVKRSTGTLFLFDPSKGCVYTVLGWSRPSVNEGRGLKEKWRAFGTPAEEFFTGCGDAKKEDKNGPNSHRCDIGGERPSAEEIKEVEDAAGDQNYGREVARAGKSGKSSSGLFKYLLISGGVLLVAVVVVIGAFKMNCSKGGKSGGKKSSKSLKKGKNSFSSSEGKKSSSIGTTTTSSAKSSRGSKGSLFLNYYLLLSFI